MLSSATFYNLPSFLWKRCRTTLNKSVSFICQKNNYSTNYSCLINTTVCWKNRIKGINFQKYFILPHVQLQWLHQQTEKNWYCLEKNLVRTNSRRVQNNRTERIKMVFLLSLHYLKKDKQRTFSGTERQCIEIQN